MSWVEPTFDPIAISDAGIFVDRKFTKMECLSYGIFLPIGPLTMEQRKKLIDMMREFYGSADRAINAMPPLKNLL